MLFIMKLNSFVLNCKISYHSVGKIPEQSGQDKAKRVNNFSTYKLIDHMNYTVLIYRENTGGITFGDFMDFLSTLSKGSAQEKIYWSFKFYDVNKDGIISRDEMIKVKCSCFKIKLLTTQDPIIIIYYTRTGSCIKCWPAQE